MEGILESGFRAHQGKPEDPGNLRRTQHLRTGGRRSGGHRLLRRWPRQKHCVTRSGEMSDAATSSIEQRLTDLEVRLTFLDGTVQSLDATVAEQDRLLLDLRRELVRLRETLSGMQTAGQDARDEPPPPHY